MTFLNRIEYRRNSDKKLLRVAAAALALTGSATAGIHPVSRPEEIHKPVVIYATSPGHVAGDGQGKNSPFTEALLKHVGTQGDTLREMFFKVAMDVTAATEGKQRPWAPEWPRRPFYFAPAEPASAPTEAKRVALVIGNGAYGGEMSPLRNPGNDARAMAEKLRGLGFDVVQGIDLDRNGFVSKMKEFSRRAEDSGSALLFYAGHAALVNGEEYLFPVDAESVENAADAHLLGLKLDDLLGMMRKTNDLLVFLDTDLNELGGGR